MVFCMSVFISMAGLVEELYSDGAVESALQEFSIGLALQKKHKRRLIFLNLRITRTTARAHTHTHTQARTYALARTHITQSITQ